MNQFGRSLQLLHVERGYWQISVLCPQTDLWVEVAHCSNEKKALALYDLISNN